MLGAVQTFESNEGEGNLLWVREFGTFVPLTPYF
jgi:hypothetical protein